MVSSLDVSSNPACPLPPSSPSVSIRLSPPPAHRPAALSSSCGTSGQTAPRASSATAAFAAGSKHRRPDPPSREVDPADRFSPPLPTSRCSTSPGRRSVGSPAAHRHSESAVAGCLLRSGYPAASASTNSHSKSGSLLPSTRQTSSAPPPRTAPAPRHSAAHPPMAQPGTAIRPQQPARLSISPPDFARHTINALGVTSFHKFFAFLFVAESAQRHPRQLQPRPPDNLQPTTCNCLYAPTVAGRISATSTHAVG